MDVQAAIGGGRRLRRIMALLLSLAVLAERAAARSFPVRFLVLWLLRQAETVAEELVFEETGIPPSAIAGVAAAGYGAEDALRLAQRLHALADALGALLRMALILHPQGGGRACPGRDPGWRGRSPRRRGAMPAAAGRFPLTPAGLAAGPHDTS